MGMVRHSCYTDCLNMVMMWMLRYALGVALNYTLSHLIAHTVNCPPQDISEVGWETLYHLFSFRSPNGVVVKLLAL